MINKVTITIELGNEAMQTWEDARRAINDFQLSHVEKELLGQRPCSYPLKDINGNTVGRIYFDTR